MSCNGTSNCTCGCCSGISVETPQVENNLPGLSSIAYRTGTWATFKDSMLARLSSSAYPALAALKTRDNDDFSIALLDATSVVLDILTFYQERLANESYLRTAVQLRSLTEMARLIGYQPAPGVAAQTYLAFSIRAATGLPPNPATPAITIPAGTQVQSVPAQGQKPQTFETSANILAKADWNALAVQTGVPWKPPGPRALYLSGTNTQLNPGDSLLLLGTQRENYVTSATPPTAQWQVVVLNSVQVDNVRGLTHVTWDREFLHEPGDSAAATWTTAKVFAFRQKLALFGDSAPSPNLFVNARHPNQTSLPALINAFVSPWVWKKFYLQDTHHIDLNASAPKWTAGTWFALTCAGKARIYKVLSSTPVSLAEFGLSAKVSRLAGDFFEASPASEFPLQSRNGSPSTEVWGQSEQLEVPEQPLDYPLYGTFLDLETSRPDLAGVAAIALTGNAQKLSVKSGLASALEFYPDDGTDHLTLKPADLVAVLDVAPLPLHPDGTVPPWSHNFKRRDLRVIDENGRTGTIKGARLSDFTLALSGKQDPVVQEFALVSSIEPITDPYPHTRIKLQSRLQNCYDRNSTSVNANAGLATAGASVSEILGSGSASTPNQKFTLKQSPLTFVQSPTATGRLSTLKVTINQAAWKEVPTLYKAAANSQVFATLNQPGGATDILSGDGTDGATLPTGQNNIQATYRVGSGLAGNVATGAITTLIDRPLGVSGVTNPSPATGGQDPQSVDGIRSNAPLSVLTLGRAVSILDYQNFAAGFAGIAKAYALWIPSGPGHGVFLTVAAAGGSALPPGNPTLGNLVTSLKSYGNPLIPINAVSFLESTFGMHADIAYDTAYDPATVGAAVLTCLQEKYSFAYRSFGQGISSDEIEAFILAVPGVVAVNVTNLRVIATSKAGDIANGAWSLYAYNMWLAQGVTLTRPCSGSPTRICPYMPLANLTALPMPAEILVLDPNPKNVTFQVMA